MRYENDYIIRSANSADIDALTDLHCASFLPKDNVPMMLGRRYVRATYRWLVGGLESYAMVADHYGNIVGLIGVCDRSYSAPMFRACLAEFALSLIGSPSLLFRRMLWRRLFARSSKSESTGVDIASYPGMAQMIIGAVAANFRGQGVFPSLVEATVPVSKARGSRAIRAGMYKTNPPIRRVFEKLGWVEVPALETSCHVFYMVALDPDLPGELGLPELRRELA
jgi:GNAT superfamily N-acetyltransferase